MKYIRIAALLSSVGLVSMATGCATITGGTTQNVSVKTQKAATDVAGANCVLTNSGGRYEVTTPGNVKVRREKDDLNIKCNKPGDVDATTTVQSSTRKGALAGNLLMTGFVGTLVTGGIDRATGAWWAYPDDITVSFGKPEAQQPVAGASVPLAASTPLVTTQSTVLTNPAPAQTN
ncbi:hypothetical protein F4827_005796 [Paraburkholderia bannensis]|uniref:Translation initiation factor 2 n=1 Tax=Paraburkholderia bannensis TaxID=765414 RepID=A0A7W9WVZ3_9BURK|nr:MULTISPECIES: hypothetical protein [Paraburkholderia]MBB3260889.1 hypothetical protein [Paraburkholderia sp. WP4_3_2]MBB6105926.1 hypothetical protein [Paraburkholderia bannensis]